MWTADYNNPGRGGGARNSSLRPLVIETNAFTRLSVSSFRGVAFREKDEFVVRGTEGSNPCTLQSGYWLVGL